MAETVSNAPWSNFKESDYTDEQWLRACLIDRGAEAGTAKQRASLPVREPSGVLNRNGVHAAAGALAGARGGLKNVSTELRAKAEKALMRLYGVLGEKAPDSLSHSVFEATLAHHGIKGQKWGVRRAINSATGLVSRAKPAKPSETTGLKPRTSSEDKIHQDRITSKLKAGGSGSLSNRDIQDFTRRLQLENDLNASLARMSAAQKAKADGFIKTFVKRQTARQFNRVADKALDLAMEKALESAGVKTNNDFAKQLSLRLKPKKGK